MLSISLYENFAVQLPPKVQEHATTTEYLYDFVWKWVPYKISPRSIHPLYTIFTMPNSSTTAGEQNYKTCARDWWYHYHGGFLIQQDPLVHH